MTSPQFPSWETGRSTAEFLILNKLRAWKVFKSVYHGFFGNTRVPDDQQCTERLLQTYEDIGCRISVGGGRGEMFYQDITQMERNYQVECKPTMMGYFYWMLLRSVLNTKYMGSSEKENSLLTVWCTIVGMYGIIRIHFVPSMVCINAIFVTCFLNR